jgi:hypothetical protein
MSLTKVSYSMIKGAYVNVFDYMTDAQIADVQARTGALDTTAAITAAIAATGTVGVLYFPAGFYGVSTLKFNKAQLTVYCDHAAQFGPVVGSTTPQTAVVVINAPNQTFNGLNISTSLNANYTAALQMASVDGTWAEFTRINGLFISDSHIGILYGKLTSPIDAPVSENYISGYWTYNVERCLYANQTNGWLFINNSTMNCGDSGTVFDPAVTCAVENISCELFISDCELLNVYGTTDYLIKNSSNLQITNIGTECPAPQFYLGDGSSTIVSNFTTVFWNEAVQWFMDVKLNATCRVQMSNSRIAKSITSAGSGNGILQTDGGGVTAKFSNCIFDNFTVQAFVNSNKYNPASAGWSEADISFANCVINDSANLQYLSIDTSNNLAGYYSLPDIAKFTVATTGTGASAAITTVSAATYKNALTLVSTATGTVTATTKINIDSTIFAQQRFAMLDVDMGVSAAATAFNAAIIVKSYDNAGNLIASQTLRGADGGGANLKGITGAQDTRRMRKILNTPSNAAQIELSFQANFAGNFTWNIGNIKVY